MSTTNPFRCPKSINYFEDEQYADDCRKLTQDILVPVGWKFDPKKPNVAVLERVTGYYTDYATRRELPAKDILEIQLCNGSLSLCQAVGLLEQMGCEYTADMYDTYDVRGHGGIWIYVDDRKGRTGKWLADEPQDFFDLRVTLQQLKAAYEKREEKPS